MDEYKIVNVTDLENGLTNIANAIKAKTGDSEGTEYEFPDGYITAIERLSALSSSES